MNEQNASAEQHLAMQEELNKTSLELVEKVIVIADKYGVSRMHLVKCAAAIIDMVVKYGFVGN